MGIKKVSDYMVICRENLDGVVGFDAAGEAVGEFFADALEFDSEDSAFVLRIVMEVNADGSVKSFYEQDEPSGGFFIF